MNVDFVMGLMAGIGISIFVGLVRSMKPAKPPCGICGEPSCGRYESWNGTEGEQVDFRGIDLCPEHLQHELEAMVRRRIIEGDIDA